MPRAVPRTVQERPSNWLVKDKDIAPHTPMIDKSKREDGTFGREDFTFDKDRNVYVCPANKILTTTGKLVNDGETLHYRTKARDCRGCPLKTQCCPTTSARKIPRSHRSNGGTIGFACSGPQQADAWYAASTAGPPAKTRRVCAKSPRANSMLPST